MISIRKGNKWLLSALVLLGLFLAGCDEIAQVAQEAPTPTAIKSTAPTMEETDHLEIVPDTGWITLRAGLESRNLNLYSDEGALLEVIYIARVDPGLFRFEVGYQPAGPLALQGWLDQSGAALAINGGFFTEKNEATGLVITNGVSYGQSYQGFGGMLAVDQDGPALRWLADEPYSPAEELTAAVQSFPMLVRPGVKIAYSNSGDDSARRSVIARDSQGNFIFVVAGIGLFTLNELSQFLIDSDLDLDSALNLDGGASSGMLLSGSNGGIPSFSLLPTVILVFEK